MSDPKVDQERMLATIKKHEKLVELAKEANNLGQITQIIFGNLSDVITDEDKVLLCYYQLMTSERVVDGRNLPQFYSCELHIITTRNFIHAGFFQSAHNLEVKSIHHVSELNIHSMFGNPFDIESENESKQDHGYAPSQLKMDAAFNNAQGEKVAQWELDTTDSSNIQRLLPQIKKLAKHVGIPLARI